MLDDALELAAGDSQPTDDLALLLVRGNAVDVRLLCLRGQREQTEGDAGRIE